MITQGTVAECFFGGRCVVNIETRNRCKACRFRRCIEEGMSMESVKMGRIPKKIKEQALREKQQHLSTISKNGVEHVPQCQYAEDQWGLTNTINDSSSSCSSSAAHWQSTAGKLNSFRIPSKIRITGVCLVFVHLKSSFRALKRQTYSMMRILHYLH